MKIRSQHRRHRRRHRRHHRPLQQRNHAWQVGAGWQELQQEDHLDKNPGGIAQSAGAAASPPAGKDPGPRAAERVKDILEELRLLPGIATLMSDGTTKAKELAVATATRAMKIAKPQRQREQEEAIALEQRKREQEGRSEDSE